MSERSVELYLLRHADAGDPESWGGPDEARPLSAKGRRQASRLGSLLAAIELRPDAVVTSPKVRARETAELAAEHLRVDVTEDSRLASGATLEDVEAILSAVGNPDRVVIVGHDPDFSEILGELTAAPDLSMKKGALARIDADRPLTPGRGVLRWLIPPDALPKEH